MVGFEDETVVGQGGGAGEALPEDAEDDGVEVAAYGQEGEDIGG